MFQNLLKRRSQLRISLKHFCYEIFKVVANWESTRHGSHMSSPKYISPFLSNTLIQKVVLSSFFKRRTTHNQLKKNDCQSKKINWLSIILLRILKHFWSHISRWADSASEHTIFELTIFLRGKTKVNYAGFALRRNYDVIGFDIAMNEIILVNMNKCGCYLLENMSSNGFWQSSFTTEKVNQFNSINVLKSNVLTLLRSVVRHFKFWLAMFDDVYNIFMSR